MSIIQAFPIPPQKQFTLWLDANARLLAVAVSQRRQEPVMYFQIMDARLYDPRPRLWVFFVIAEGQEFDDALIHMASFEDPNGRMWHLFKTETRADRA